VNETANGALPNGNDQVELEMTLLEAQQQAHIEELHQQQAREREKQRRHLLQQQQEYEAQQREYEQQPPQQQGTDMDWDVVMDGGAEPVDHPGNGDNPPSPINLLSQEALDALRDDHHHHLQQQQQQQRQVSAFDHRPSYEHRTSTNFGQGFARSIGTTGTPQQPHSPYASSPLAAAPPHSAPASRRGSAHSLSGDSPAARSASSAPAMSNQAQTQNQMDDSTTFAFGGYELDPNDEVEGSNNNNNNGGGELDELNQHHHLDIDLDGGAPHGSNETFFAGEEFYA